MKEHKRQLWGPWVASKSVARRLAIQRGLTDKERQAIMDELERLEKDKKKEAGG